MKRMFKRILSMMLVIALLFLATVPVFAVDDEEYLSDLRLIYADDYDEAKEILEDSDFADYELLDVNLNENTGKTGVFLAYQVTTDIEDAITDIAVMQMNGGYNEGNYQAMIEQSYNEYLEFGENYLTAIEYFKTGYDAGHYLSEIAYRQLNFYNVVTEGIDEIPYFEGELLGDIFFSGIDASDLATMFMEGNSYALKNIRSLIAMGVSYNENGKTYLENVADEVAKYNEDKSVYDNEDYDELAELVSLSIIAIKDMFKELEAYESELNYEDEEHTDLEIEFLEYMSVATMMRNVQYLNGKTLYDFCKEYAHGNDYSSLYPLIAALNEGQLAMTLVNHYYDVVRYSVAMQETDEINAELDELEQKYIEEPFNVYTGVDRTIYRGTFALTSEAYRADAFTESGLGEYLWGGVDDFGKVMNTVGIIGASIFATAVGADIMFTHCMNRLNSIQSAYLFKGDGGGFVTTMLKSGKVQDLPEYYGTWKYYEAYDYLKNYMNDNPALFTKAEINELNAIEKGWNQFVASEPKVCRTAKIASIGDTISPLITTMYLVGGAMTLISAIKIGIEIRNYYHPEYDDIPTAMVDLIDTKDGDRYIKYDVVYEAEYNDNGDYSAADLNAFSANRWNALYFTKSYEAGKPLLANEFKVSYNNHTPDKNYAPVHRFGEVISYNLNKYNFNDDYSIYLSVKQSENQKAAVTDVPEIVGSVFSTGYIVLAGGIGIIAGIGGVLGSQEILKIQKKKKAEDEAEAD